MSKYIAILLLIFTRSASADAYVDAGKSFVEIEDLNQQAEAWAVCAASYDIMSTIMRESSPERARQLNDLGHGAKLAVGMTLVMGDLDPEISDEKFKALWEKSQAAMSGWPQKKLSAILADAELLGSERSDEFGRKINATVVTCINNLEGQQRYIASWKALVESGLLAVPEN